MKAMGDALKKMRKSSHLPAEKSLETEGLNNQPDDGNDSLRQESTDRAPKGVQKLAHVSKPIHGNQMNGELAMGPEEAVNGLGPQHMDALASLVKDHDSGRKAIGLDEKASNSAKEKMASIMKHKKAHSY